MKRSPLKRKTPLQNISIAKQQELSESKRYWNSTFTKRSTDHKPPKSVGRNQARQGKGLVGHGRTSAQIQFHTKVISTGCFACNHLGYQLTVPGNRLCIHHIRGRSNGKQNDISEWLVMCLCHAHHDPSSMCIGSSAGIPSAHGNKRLFIEMIGTELWCVYETYRRLHIKPVWVSDSCWNNYIEEGDSLTRIVLAKALPANMI